MRYSLYLILIFLLSCNSSTKAPVPESSKALTIVNKAIDAHGGYEYWKSIESIKFRKETTLFKGDGSIEKDVNEIHTLHQQDTLYGNIINIDAKPENKYTTTFADGVGKKVLNGKTTDATNAFLSSHFVVNQPFKLLDPGIDLSYLGKDTLSSGKIVDVVKAFYGTPEDDVWWFYFDVKTHILQSTLIYHAPTYAYVDNEVTKEIDGLLWNIKRTTYRTDSLRNIEYVRAKFLYEVLETNNSE